MSLIRDWNGTRTPLGGMVHCVMQKKPFGEDSDIEDLKSKLEPRRRYSATVKSQLQDVKACLSDLHNKYVFVPADKAPNNIMIICKRYYIETLIKELGLDNSSTATGNSTYTPCQMSSEDIVNTHDTFMKSFGIELSDNDKRLPYLYWTPKLHKSPVKHPFIAGSSKCNTKQLSSLLTKILTVIKTGLEKYCSIKTSHTGVNNMWIRKEFHKFTVIIRPLGSP